MIIKNAVDAKGEKITLYVSGGVFVSTTTDCATTTATAGSATTAGTAATGAAGGEVIDAAGLTILPGLCDMHVHLRDPGQTEKEDIKTGTAAAAAGGFTNVACMPNTTPAVSTPGVLKYILDKAKSEGSARVLPFAAITEGLCGEKQTDFTALKAAGAVGFSDDGRPVTSDAMMKKAIVDAAEVSAVISSHCEAVTLSKGVMNEGAVQRELGVAGLPKSAEDLMIARDAVLAAETGCGVHIAHVSTESGLEIIRCAKARGVKITCESCPHYFTLTDEAVKAKGANAKMSPPLRTERDRLAVIAAISDGTVDVITTDHAPHTAAEKGKSLTDAPNGIVGLESALPLAYTMLVKAGHITLERLTELMSARPLELLRQKKNDLKVGDPADFVLIDTKTPFIFKADKLHSKSHNTPFDGMELYGEIKLTVMNGKITYMKEQI